MKSTTSSNVCRATNASLSRKGQTITRNEWLNAATAQLKTAGIDSARLDSELILTHCLNISRTTLHAHDDEALAADMRPVLEAMLSLRVIRVPLAYIVGHREFYGRLFKVTPSVLIPRPETEDIVTIIKDLPAARTIIDVGTGSGALAVTLALQQPHALVIGADISSHALAVARQNSDTYQANVSLQKSDLLTSIGAWTRGQHPAIIVANLPYVALDDDRSPETRYEPEEALFAADDGLDLIKRLIVQATERLLPNDYLLLESNPRQQPAIVVTATKNGFALEQTRHLITVFRRV